MYVSNKFFWKHVNVTDYLINVSLIKHYMMQLVMEVTVLNVDSTRKGLIVKAASLAIIEMNMINAYHVIVMRKVR